MSAGKKSLRKQYEYAHPIEDVWAALTDPRALAEWLMPNDFVPVVGHRFRFQFDPNLLCRNGVVRCEVLELDAPTRMVWSWTHEVGPGGVAPPPMRLEWRLERTPRGTRLMLEQTGLEGQGFLTVTMMRIGWFHMLRDLLPKVLNRVNAGSFTPGAIPLGKRSYRVKTVPRELVY